MEIEIAVHRRYNINTNFDVIEIGGEYDIAVRAALNRAVQALVESGNVDFEALVANKDLLRLRDPTDHNVKRVPCPDQIDWIDPQLSEEAFTGFADIGELQTNYAKRDLNWITLFEDTEQRLGDTWGARSHRLNKVRVIVFGLPKGSISPSLRYIKEEAAIRPLRNRYRFELSNADCPVSVATVIPLVVTTYRSFRGRHAPMLAAVMRERLDGINASPSSEDPFGYAVAGKPIIRSIEWQSAFDQGRRRHEPTSGGFLLQIEKAALQSIADRYHIELWTHLAASRSTDRYKEEAQMAWHRHSAVSRLM